MMGIGHIFTVRARLEQINRDNTLNLRPYDLASVRNIYPALAPSTEHRSALELARRVYDSGHDIRACNHYFMRWAASHDNLPLMRELYRLGADPAACNGYATRYAAFNGNLGALRWLHGLGHVVRHRDDAVAYAAGKGHVHILDFLESTGPLQIPPVHALFTAARAAKRDAMEWLVARGVDPRAENDYIMFHALASADIPTLEWVKAHGVDLHAFAGFGQIHAAWSGSVAVFNWCEDNGIPVDPHRIASSAANCGHAALLEWAQKRGGIAEAHAEKAALVLGMKNGDDRLQSLIMEQRVRKSAALVDSAINDILSPPTLATRMLRMLKRQGPP